MLLKRVDIPNSTDIDVALKHGAYSTLAAAFGMRPVRLRLRLPPITGVRPISPPVAFGSSAILVEATRLPEQTSRLPLEPGSKTWLGVHRIHTLEHPGLSFLIITDGSRRAQEAISLGGQIARLAHARVTLIGCGLKDESLQAQLQEARKQLGSGLAALDVQTSLDEPARAVTLAVEQQPYDMVVLGYNHKEDNELAERILQVGEHHLLFGKPLSMELIFGLILQYLAYGIGVPWADSFHFGSLIGTKVVLNEFVAYLDLATLVKNGAMSEKGIIMATYALCGFANFASIAIQIGGISPLAPERRKDISALGLRAVLGGTLATLMTATLAGLLV